MPNNTKISLWEREGPGEWDQLPHKVSHSTVTNQGREERSSLVHPPEQHSEAGTSQHCPFPLSPKEEQSQKQPEMGFSRKGVWLLLEPVLQHHHRAQSRRAEVHAFHEKE